MYPCDYVISERGGNNRATELVRTPSMTRNWVETRFNLPTTLMPVSTDFFAVLMIGSESCSTFNCSKKYLSVSNSGFGSFEFRPLFTTYMFPSNRDNGWTVLLFLLRDSASALTLSIPRIYFTV